MNNHIPCNMVDTISMVVISFVAIFTIGICTLKSILLSISNTTVAEIFSNILAFSW